MITVTPTPGNLRTVQTIAAGTAYTLTAVSSALDFGTTDPSITLDQAGTWLILGSANTKYNGATFAAVRTITLKFHRTNNTAADITGGSTALLTNIITALTYTLGMVTLPITVYTTSNTNDAITIFGDIGVVPTAGSVDITEAQITAIKIG